MCIKARQRIFVLAQELADEGDDADWSKLVAQVDKYRDRLLEAWKAGNDELGAEIRPPLWNFWGSLYYCITLFTTIGRTAMLYARINVIAICSNISIRSKQLQLNARI